MEKNGFSQRPRRLAILATGAALLLVALPVSASAQDTSTANAGGSFVVGSGQKGDGVGSSGTATGGSAHSQPATSSGLKAGEPTGDQYLDTVTRISTSTSPTPAPPSAGGGLPFTGFDVGIVALVGAALLGLGLTIRRVGTRGIDA